MISAQYGSGNDLPAFAVAEDDPYYWLMRASYEYTVTLNNLREAGISIDRPEITDFDGLSALGDDLTTKLTDILDTIKQGQYQIAQSGISDADWYPLAMDLDLSAEITQLLLLVVAGNWSAIFVLFVQVGIKVLLYYLGLDQGDTPATATNALLAGLLKYDGSEVVSFTSRVEPTTTIVQSVEDIAIDSLDYTV